MNKPMNEPRPWVLVLDRATGRPTAQVPILAIAEVTITPQQLVKSYNRYHLACWSQMGQDMFHLTLRI